jgi:hypothetical protein
MILDASRVLSREVLVLDGSLASWDTPLFEVIHHKARQHATSGIEQVAFQTLGLILDYVGCQV